MLIDWGEEGHLPNKIYGFLDFSDVNLPSDPPIEHAGTLIEPGIYAIVENAQYVEVEADGIYTSEIFVPMTKEVGGLTGNLVSHLRFYLADVEAFMEPLSVIPDIGGPPNNYFMVRDRSKWAEGFSSWLESPLDIREEISDCEED